MHGVFPGIQGSSDRAVSYDQPGSNMADLRRDPRVKVGVLLKVRPSDFVVEKNFNVRLQSPALEEHIESIKASIMMGDIPPPLAVRCVGREIILRDGHCRLEAYRRAISAGAPVEFIDAVEWRGSDIDAIVYMVKSANGKPLEPLEVAQAYKRLRAFNWTEVRIAERFAKTETHVRQMLLLADADQTIQELVRTERIAASTAVRIIQQHGKDATQIIREAIVEATAAGKEKVTPRHLVSVRKPKNATPALAGLNQQKVMGALQELRSYIESDASQARLDGGDEMVSVPSALLRIVLSLTDAIEPDLPPDPPARRREIRNEPVRAREMVSA